MKDSKKSLSPLRGLIAITLTALTLAFFVASSATMAHGVITGTGQEHTVTSKNERLKGVFAGIKVAVDNAHVNLSGATVDCRVTMQTVITTPGGGTRLAAVMAPVSSKASQALGEPIPVSSYHQPTIEVTHFDKQRRINHRVVAMKGNRRNPLISQGLAAKRANC